MPPEINSSTTSVARNVYTAQDEGDSAKQCRKRTIERRRCRQAASSQSIVGAVVDVPGLGWDDTRSAGAWERRVRQTSSGGSSTGHPDDKKRTPIRDVKRNDDILQAAYLK